MFHILKCRLFWSVHCRCGTLTGLFDSIIGLAAVLDHPRNAVFCVSHRQKTINRMVRGLTSTTKSASQLRLLCSRRFLRAFLLMRASFASIRSPAPITCPDGNILMANVRACVFSIPLICIDNHLIRIFGILNSLISLVLF